MQSHWTRCLLATALVTGAASAGAQVAPLEVIGCETLADTIRTSVQKVEFESTDRVGNERGVSATVSWKRFDDGLSRVFVRVHTPPDMTGAGLLMIEKDDRADMFVYLPDLKKVKRVTSRMLSGSMFGSDFTYEDFMQLQGMATQGRTERLEDATLDGVPVRVVAHFPSSEAGSSYERVVTHWDVELCVPLKIEMWEAGERLRKVLSVDRAAVLRTHGTGIPQKLLMRDLRDETSTKLNVDDIEVDVEIPRKLFSTASLERSGRR